MIYEKKDGDNELGTIELATDRLRKIIEKKDEEIERLQSHIENLEEKWRDHVCEVPE